MLGSETIPQKLPRRAAQMDKRAAASPRNESRYERRDQSRLAEFEVRGGTVIESDLRFDDNTFGGRLDAFAFPAIMATASVLLAFMFSLIAVQLELHHFAATHFVTIGVTLAALIALPLSLVAGLREHRKWRSYQAMRSVAAVDPLTGLLNRRSFSISIDEELRRMARTGHAAAIILFDLDHFKRLNDEYGHRVGDEVLTKIAAIAYAELRNPFDRLARWGGEEFIILLHDMTDETAKGVCERLRQCIEGLSVEAEGVTVPFTASFGGSLLHPNQPFEEALSRADSALYDSKANGRNQVQFRRHLAPVA